ncbi:response regulator [Candidatus Magnetominusculus dajiuhuensis]|uniref:response regulator n=1 Tax=Candidatus Magnetominusculus dajiuhuensis TaxID=3137712 RepID=UPI003B42C34A
MEQTANMLEGAMTSGINILVVEDEIITARDIEAKLKKLGHGVVGIASSGEDAIQKAAELTPDMILMDITLDGKMDGIEASMEIEKHQNVPIIYLTAHTDLITLHRAKVTEPHGYIVKPFTQRDLIITISMALYKHRMEMKLQIMNQMLSLFLEPIALEKKLHRALEMIVSIPRMFLQTRGCIYLVENDPNALTLKASLSNSDCPTVAVGQCLCGLAAAKQEVVFSDKMDKRHPLMQDDIPHGHYCVPILAEGALLGVMNIYVKDGHKYDASEENILTAYANVIANALHSSK